MFAQKAEKRLGDAEGSVPAPVVAKKPRVKKSRVAKAKEPVDTVTREAIEMLIAAALLFHRRSSALHIASLRQQEQTHIAKIREYQALLEVTHARTTASDGARTSTSSEGAH